MILLTGSLSQSNAKRKCIGGVPSCVSLCDFILCHLMLCTCSEMVSMAAVSRWSVMLSTERDSATSPALLYLLNFLKYPVIPNQCTHGFQIDTKKYRCSEGGNGIGITGQIILNGLHIVNKFAGNGTFLGNTFKTA